MQSQVSPPSNTRKIWILVSIAVVLTVSLNVISSVVVRSQLRAYYIPSEAMEPTLRVDDRILVKTFGKVERGTIVVFDAPGQLQVDGIQVLVKRVVGMPGETIRARDGQIEVKNATSGWEVVDEPPVEEATADFDPIEIPDDSYFMLGDNRDKSKDSRSFGPIPKDDVIGVAWLIYFPSDRIELL